MGGRASRTFDSLDVRIRKGSTARKLGAAALTTYVGALVVHAFWPLSGAVFATVVIAVPVALVASALGFHSVSRRVGSTAQTHVGASADATVGRLSFGRSQVVRAHLVSGPDSVHVEIALQDGDHVRIRTTLDQGRGILEAMGLDAEHHALRLPLGGEGTAIAVCVLLGGFLVLVAALIALSLAEDVPHPVLALSFAGLGVALVPILRGAAFVAAPQNVVLGTDGLSLEPWSRQFVPWSRLDGVSVHRGNLVVWLRGGDFVRVYSSEMFGPRATLVVDRIRAGIATFRPSRGLLLFDREGRDAAEWLGSLRRVLVHEAGYRDAAVARDEVVRVLEDPGVRRDRRFAAGVALAAAGEVDRVRSVAEACADPALRSALLAAAGDSLDALAFEAWLEHVR